jgi:hypothetical protein
MKLLRALHEVFARRVGAVCPPPSRWWAVALHLDCWTAAERRHISACPGCLRLRSAYHTP